MSCIMIIWCRVSEYQDRSSFKFQTWHSMHFRKEFLKIKLFDYFNDNFPKLYFWIWKLIHLLTKQNQEYFFIDSITESFNSRIIVHNNIWHKLYLIDKISKLTLYKIFRCCDKIISDEYTDVDKQALDR